MKLVAVTRILNEADIVEAFVRHTAALVDYHVFLDNGSTDATIDIVRALHAEGLPIEMFRNDAVAFAELNQNNFLFRTAVERHAADWVLPLDCDEFFAHPKHCSGFRDVLSASTTNALKVRVREYIPTPDDDMATLLIPARITHARPPADNLKVIVRGGVPRQGAVLLPGGHGATLNGSEIPYELSEGIVYAHFATRSPWQWVTKFTMGWSKVLAAGAATVAAGNSSHYREPFRILTTNPAAILRNPEFMKFRHNEAGLSFDPITYLGAPLRYTQPVDYPMRAVQALAVHLERLSARHGEMTNAASKP